MNSAIQTIGVPPKVFPSHTFRRSLFGGGPSSTVQTHRLTKKLNVPIGLLYGVVSDVSRYQEFVPFVNYSYIKEYDELTRLPAAAGLRVGWKTFDEEFLCKLHCKQNESVRAESVTITLFAFLETEWRFKELKSRQKNKLVTLVDFDLKFKFKNSLYNNVSFMFKDQVSQIMMKAFEDRALHLQAEGEKE